MPKRKKKLGSNALEVQNAAKTLYANIRFISVDNPIRSIVLTSSVPNEGKTTTAIELGRSMATSGKSVLLVEADMRRRSLAAALGVRAKAGIYSVLSGQTPPEKAVVETKTEGLFFLDVEPSIPNPADIIASRRFRSMVSTFENECDYVIFDTPPVGTFVDAAILSTVVDATIMVSRPNFVKREEAVHAYEQLQKAGANVIGICMTFVEGSGAEYYYAYYTEDGKRMKERDSRSSAFPLKPVASPKRGGNPSSKRSSSS